MAYIKVTINDPQDTSGTIDSYWFQMYFQFATNGDQTGTTVWEIFTNLNAAGSYGQGVEIGRIELPIGDAEATNTAGDVIQIAYGDLATQDQGGIFDIVKLKTVRFNGESVDLSTGTPVT